MTVERQTPGSGEDSINVDSHGSACPRCDYSFPSTDEMLDHLNSHLRHAGSSRDAAAGPSMLLSAMPAWQVDAALSDLERSMRTRRPFRLVRMLLTYALVLVIVLAAVVLVVAGNPALGAALAVFAVLLADGRPVRYLGKICLGHRQGTGTE